MRRRSEPHTFEQRLTEERVRLERELTCLPDGRRREVVIARLEQLQAAADMYDFLSPPRQAAASR